MYKQDPPYTVKIEFTQGCNFNCSFCGVKVFNGQEWKFLSVETLTRIVEEVSALGWKSKIELTMHGEPTLNPLWLHLISIIRSTLPDTQIMLSTNGAGFVVKPGPKNIVNIAFECGVNLIVIEKYNHSKLWKRIVVDGKFEVCEYPLQKWASPNKKWHKGTKAVIFLEDLKDMKEGTHARINNGCGSAYPGLSIPMMDRCVRPFREITFRWDGKVAVCCNDWKGELICGDIMKEGLEKIWQGHEFDKARSRLYYYDREFIPCNVCDDWGGYRKGLLPDRMGKQTISTWGGENE